VPQRQRPGKRVAPAGDCCTGAFRIVSNCFELFRIVFHAGGPHALHSNMGAYWVKRNLDGALMLSGDGQTGLYEAKTRDAMSLKLYGALLPIRDVLLSDGDGWRG
jgi:hypothetical protein